MNQRAGSLLVACSVAAVLAMPVRLAGQDSLAAARQLYASAEYSSALTMLNGLLATNPSPQDRQSIDLYRVFCLFAVDNLGEANDAIEAMMLRDPLYRPSMDEVPRRLRTAFADARKRLLPSIIEQKYMLAKTAFDRGDFKTAAAVFTETLTALSDPDIAAAVQQRPLSEIRVLATGFNELAVRAMAPPPAPQVAETAPAPEPPARSSRIYDGHDTDVTMPVVVRQDIPAFPGQVFAQKNGLIDVVIDETGSVESVAIVASVDPRYNLLVLAAARAWQYQPAKVGGVPVKFRKRIQISLAPNR